MKYNEKKRKIILTETDYDILTVLYKLDFATEKQLSVMIGERHSFVKGRCKQLCEGGLIERKAIQRIAVNYITKDGIIAAGLSPRNVHEPKLSKYEHSLGFADVCTWLSMWRRFKDGSYHSWIPFGSIITERDFCSVKEMHIIKHRADGQPVYASADRDIHASDGYIIRPDGTYTAIEYERTHKSSKKLIKQNILENAKRFRTQYWIFDDPYIGRQLEKIKSEFGNNIIILDIRKIRSDIDAYVANLPAELSAKSGKPRRSCLGQMLDPIPLNRLPVLTENQQKIVLERRSPVANGDHVHASDANHNVSTVNQSQAKAISNSAAYSTSGTSTHSEAPANPGKPLFFEKR